MGALYGWTTRKDTISHLIQADEPRLHTLAHCVRGNILWTVQKWEHRTESFIGCYILLGPVDGKGDPYACGYKDLTEEMHPYYYNCPIKYLDMAPEVCPEWRAKVREKAAKRATKLAPGIVAELQHTTVPAVTIETLKPLRGRCVNSGFTYRIPRKMLTGRTFHSVEAYREATQA